MSIRHGNHTMKCALQDPYPEPKVVKQNRHIAALLLDDYAGMISEFTAINQYTYHFLRIEPENIIASELLHCISIVEMHHFSLLGQTIDLLGAPPKFHTIKKNCAINWNAELIYYGDFMYDQLKADIKSEKDAIRQYNRHRKMISDPNINLLLERIISDEEYHLELLTNIFNEYCRK